MPSRKTLLTPFTFMASCTIWLGLLYLTAVVPLWTESVWKRSYLTMMLIACIIFLGILAATLWHTINTANKNCSSDLKSKHEEKQEQQPLKTDVDEQKKTGFAATVKRHWTNITSRLSWPDCLCFESENSRSVLIFSLSLLAILLTAVSFGCYSPYYATHFDNVMAAEWTVFLLACCVIPAWLQGSVVAKRMLLPWVCEHNAWCAKVLSHERGQGEKIKALIADDEKQEKEQQQQQKELEA